MRPRRDNLQNFVWDRDETESLGTFSLKTETRPRLSLISDENNIDQDKNEINFAKRRITNLKNNATVIFPKTRDFTTESKFRLMRIETMEVFMNYMGGKCGKGLRQTSNLYKNETAGL